MKLILKSGLLAAMMLALVGTTTTQAAIYDKPLPLSACLAGKAKCVTKTTSCLLGCYNKVVGKGLTVSPGSDACITKCRDGFLPNTPIDKSCWEKLDIKNAGCDVDSMGDAMAAIVRSKIEARAYDVYSAMVPSGATITNKCAAGKIKCSSKYNACVLGALGKILKTGGTATAASFTKCDAIMIGEKSCVAKLEAKGAFEGDAPCTTFGDAASLKTGNDAFINDILYNFLAGEQNANTKRCTGDTAVQCVNTAPDCAVAGGTCEFFFGSPLPLSAGGTSTCVTNQWSGGISGTFNQANGASAGTANVIARAYLSASIPEPCPRCAGAAAPGIPNDGVADGTCTGGPNVGDPCDVNGESPVPSFGKTSLDCPPPAGTLVGTLPINLDNTNAATVTKTLVAGSPGCNGSPGDKCLCASCSLNSLVPCFTDADCALAGAGTCTNNAGEPRSPNACTDDTTLPADGTICGVTPGGNGLCAEGPVDQRCTIETFRGCMTNVDCPLAGDSCTTAPRPCFAGLNGTVGESISSVGAHGAPSNHTGHSTFASIFCVAPTGSAAVNNAAGLPGPGRLRLGGVAFEDGGVACPTIATFLPTATSGVLDTGWTGFAHQAQIVGQGKVTVGVTSCIGAPGSCVCSYTGPVANP